jgi:GTPase involved in cell partitioning and DNA repair
MTQDIVTRLRRWTFAPDAQPRGDIMDEAADEIERLRNEVARLTLTDEERKAIVVVNKLSEMQFGESDFSLLVRKMLKRLGESQEDILRKVGA